MLSEGALIGARVSYVYPSVPGVSYAPRTGTVQRHAYKPGGMVLVKWDHGPLCWEQPERLTKLSEGAAR